MARDDSQHKHRLPPVLKAMLEDAAKANKRSLTAEINDRLEKSFLSSGESISSEGNMTPAILRIDSKLQALCNHLGVKLD